MERYYSVHRSETPLHVKPGKSVTFTFDGKDMKDADRLFFTGQASLFYQWKNEPDHPMLYRRIDDSLNVEESELSQYCLDLSADNFDYPILAHHKILFPPKLSYLKLNDYGDRWLMGLRIKTENLKIHEGGYLHFLAEVRYKKEGTDPHSVQAPADESFRISLPEGTRDWTVLEEEISFRARETASVCIYLEGERYSGKVFAECPQFRSDSGWNLLPEFTPEPPNRPQFAWIGCNLSKKEWPEFEIALNGEVFFRGEIFDRCHLRSETEIPLKGLAVQDGENRLTIKLTSHYRDPLAYDLYEVALLGHAPTFVAACPKTVTAGVPFGVLVKGKKGERAELVSDEVKPVDLTMEEEGLNVLLLRCDEPKNGICFTLKYGDKEEALTVDRCVLRQEDGVITGTGDMIYVDTEDEPTDNFLRWYLENEVGNLLTIRPTYRWSGIRKRNDPLWSRVARLLTKAGIKYSHMRDGRELPGCDANPSESALMSPAFLGRQNHEFDGAFSYWGGMDHTNDANQELFIELLQRRFRTHGEHMCALRGAPSHMVEKGGKRQLFRDPTLPEDMEICGKALVKGLADGRCGSTRHTGPSSLFKYFYQAGYDWTGAELMYGPQETVCAALRGAAKAYRRPVTGAHHAIQWSTTPHDSKEKNLRYRLALYGTYLQGINEINTEEGLWHVEEYYAGYNRFSDCCLNHKKEQQDFYRYVQTHSRTGRFHAPIAFLHGRYDGWDVFTENMIWGKTSMGYTDAEKGWNLIRFFYPRNVALRSIYRHPCPNESVGFYSGTPYGNVDIYPMEGEDFSDYSLLIAAGYNKALPEDMDKLEAYVSAGGTLLLGWPQCSVTTDRKKTLAGEHTYLKHPFPNRILPEQTFVSDTFKGLPLTVGASPVPADASPLLKTDSDRVLAYSVPLEKGKTVFVNAVEYAGNPAVRAIYEELLHRFVPEALNKEAVYGEGDRDVQFSLFRQPDGSDHLYFMATDWYNGDETLRQGTLILGQNRYTVPASLVTPTKVVVNQGIAAWSNEGENEVLSVSEGEVTVQGIGRGTFTLAHGGKTETVTVDFAREPVQKILLNQ